MISVARMAAPLSDVQAERDVRGVAIDRVGVTRVRTPLRVLGRDGQRQHTVATVNLFASLAADVRGTHMSRFLEVLHRHPEVSPTDALGIAEELRLRLDADTARVEMEFPFFQARSAPVSGATGVMEFACGLRATAGPGAASDLALHVQVSVATLCPCSREISERGAHNQRGVVDLWVRASAPIWFEELIEVVESSASCALYPVLKRPDEKWVTERAYDNPRFVEDLLREVAVELRSDSRIGWYRVEVENQESIHAHNAFAAVEHGG